MLLQLLLLYVCLRTSAAGYVSVQLPYANPAGINYVSGQHHYQAGLLAGPAVRYPVSVASSAPAFSPHHAVQVIGSPSYYSYNLPNPVSVPVHPFHAYQGGHAAVTPVTYGALPRPTVVAVAAPQPAHSVVTQYHHHNIAPVAHVPTATAVPVHVPVAAVTPIVPIAPVHPQVRDRGVTKTVSSEESSVSSSTEIPLPVIKSRKYKVRRPAIQNQFYDIEERVIIRPVGSALVELEHPVSRTETSIKTHTVQTDSGSHGQGRTTTTTVTQKPPLVPTHTVYHQTPVPQAPALVPHPVVVHASSAGHVVPQAFVPQYQPAIYVNQVQPIYIPTSTVPASYPVTTFKPTYPVTVPVFTTPAPTTGPYPATTEGDVNYDDTVVVEARSGGRTIHVETSSEAPLEHSTAQAPIKYRKKCDEDDDETVDVGPKRGDIAITYATEATHESLSSSQENSTDIPSTTEQPEEQETTSVEINGRLAVDESNQTQSAQIQTSARSADFNEVSSSTPRIIITNSGSAEQAKTNQEQFIRLLSERDSISEVSYGPNTDTSSSLINTYVRSRVLSATPAPSNAKETSRTVNIRRIIVSRPIETEQEVEVHEQSYPAPAIGHGYRRQTTASSEQVPVYTTAKPPAFANDDDVK